MTIRWWRRPKRCDMVSVLGETCGAPAIACVRMWGMPMHICAWHAEPFDQGKSAMEFLAQSLLPRPT